MLKHAVTFFFVQTEIVVAAFRMQVATVLGDHARSNSRM